MIGATNGARCGIVRGMTYSEEDLTAIVQAIREGYIVTVGGSRCHTDYFARDQSLWMQYFDEGYTEEHEIDERLLRAAIASNPREFASCLDVERWRRCEQAMMAGDWSSVESALDGLRASDSLQTAAVLRAVAALDAKPISDELRELIRSRERSRTLYHVYMHAVGWQRSRAVFDRALEWLSRVEAALGERCEQTRASFERERAQAESRV
jgi:hypothetical protein